MSNIEISTRAAAATDSWSFYTDVVGGKMTFEIRHPRLDAPSPRTYTIWKWSDIRGDYCVGSSETFEVAIDQCRRAIMA